MNQERQNAMTSQIQEALEWFCTQGHLNQDVSRRIMIEIDSVIEEHLHACRRGKPIPPIDC